MSRALTFTPEAQTELCALSQNYFAIRAELGDRFNRAFDAVIALIEKYPEVGSQVLRHSRRIKLKKFPYHIYYRFKKHQVVIWAIFHAHRDLKPLRKMEKLR